MNPTDPRTAVPSGQELAPLAALLDPAYPERLREIAEQLYTALVRDPDARVLGEDALARLALAQTEHLSQTLGGGQFYMHKGSSYRLSLRDREMCAQFKGDNYHALARQYNRTEMRVRQIVDAYQREQFERRQISLIGIEASRPATTRLQKTA